MTVQELLNRLREELTKIENSIEMVTRFAMGGKIFDETPVENMSHRIIFPSGTESLTDNNNPFLEADISKYHRECKIDRNQIKDDKSPLSQMLKKKRGRPKGSKNKGKKK